MRLACNGLFSWFEKKAVIVTPTRLLASVASEQFTRYQLERGIESWQRPPIYSVDAWLAACWQEARYSGGKVPALLSPSQERLLWQDIIEQEAPELFDVASTARLSMAAARTLAEWQIAPGGELWRDHQDAQHFLRWHRLFRKRCRERDWITRPDLWGLLPEWLKQGTCERQLSAFSAFTTTTPALALVKETLGLWGVTESVPPRTSIALAPIHRCQSFGEELELAARQARQVFEQDPRRSLGVLIPDLTSHFSEVQRAFENVFYPADALRFIERRQSPADDSVFHINASFPIYSIAVVANALLLLELTHDRIATADAAAILRSRYIGGAVSERSGRAMADLNLRKRRDIDVSLRDMEEGTRHCPLLFPVWRQVQKVIAGMTSHADFASWSDFIRDLLEAAGWPGDTERTSEEQEAVELWKDTVSTLATLGMVSGPVSFQTAVLRLKGLLAGGAPETGTWSSPIQIVDAADATALEFDHAFLIGLSEEHWPPVNKVSSLIPLAVQRAHGIPGSSRQSAYEQRERMTSALFEAAPSATTITFSGRLSPLVERFVSREAHSLMPWAGKLPAECYAYVKLEEREDSNAPPFYAVEPSRGGTSIVKSQSLCPFRAFAEHRLLSNAPEEACIGFDSRDRGSFLHQALQFVWETLRTQARLRSTNREDLQGIVRDAVLRSVREDPSSPFHQLATSAEWERLETLVLKWLEVERDRAQPFTVETLEEKRSYEIPGLRLRLRIDRMDRLANGSVLLIDYKSGKQTVSKLEGERPAEPQLLVYAAATKDRVDGVFFGELTPREPRAVGHGRTLHFGKRAVKKDWDSFIEQAKRNVEEIALGFVEGKAAVDPIKGACDYCSQKPFCRINEKAASDTADDDDE